MSVFIFYPLFYPTLCSTSRKFVVDLCICAQINWQTTYTMLSGKKYKIEIRVRDIVPQNHQLSI